ncbi:SRPBCC family protein [Nocardia stercoris]|uniref:SRPBCC family protein n=1 Tax=Nocardia stercoris TaxID=2483361 RepID=UPI0018F2A124|nr:SRPBCC family protein [Nocardia stercoris]
MRISRGLCHDPTPGSRRALCLSNSGHRTLVAVDQNRDRGGMNRSASVPRAAAIGVATFIAGLIVGYPILARSAVRTWGSRADECLRAMPGDDLITDPDVITTRAVTIAAAPETIWPWLVQFGPDRGGIYSYDWIDRLLGVPVHSSMSLLPQFAHISVGDLLSITPGGPKMRVAVVEPARALVFESEDGNWVWSFVLSPIGDSTRLVSRNRITVPSNSIPSRLLYCYLLEPGSLVMEAKMLRGIRDRAEHTVLPAGAEPSPRATEPIVAGISGRTTAGSDGVLPADGHCGGST